MIQVSKINGQKVWINSDLIRTIDQIPETRIVFIDDVIILVQETPEMIRGKIINFKSNFIMSRSQQVEEKGVAEYG